MSARLTPNQVEVLRASALPESRVTWEMEYRRNGSATIYRLFGTRRRGGSPMARACGYVVCSAAAKSLERRGLVELQVSPWRTSAGHVVATDKGRSALATLESGGVS